MPHQQSWPTNIEGELPARESEHPKRAYFEKYSDMDANVERVKKATGQDIKQLGNCGPFRFRFSTVGHAYI